MKLPFSKQKQPETMEELQKASGLTKEQFTIFAAVVAILRHNEITDLEGRIRRQRAEAAGQHSKW